MTKEEMISLLKVAGCDSNTITAMSNAFDIGFEDGLERSAKLIKENIMTTYDRGIMGHLIELIGIQKP